MPLVVLCGICVVPSVWNFLLKITGQPPYLKGRDLLHVGLA